MYNIGNVSNSHSCTFMVLLYFNNKNCALDIPWQMYH